MKNMVNQSTGLTLIELLLTLFILSIFLSISLPIISSMVDHYLLEMWINQFTVNYFWARQQAMVLNSWIEIKIVPSSHYYLIRNVKVLKLIPYSKNLNVTDNMGHTIRFDAIGEINHNGTILVSNKKETRAIVLQMITGQLYVE